MQGRKNVLVEDDHRAAERELRGEKKKRGGEQDEVSLTAARKGRFADSPKEELWSRFANFERESQRGSLAL